MRNKSKNKMIVTLERKAIRRHVFLPSQIDVWTVIGEEGDNLVNERPLFCSCKDFYFNLLKKEKKPCYHLSAFLIAKKREGYSTFYYKDEEFESFMKMLFKDLK